MKTFKRKHKSGFFFSFEGGEGAGKTTLIDELSFRLSQLGIGAFQTREPGGTPLGKDIRELLLNTNEPVTSRSELFLFLADRAQHVDMQLIPALERGEVILCDRYIDSSFAYQGEEFGFSALETIMQFATAGLLPDITFYLDLDPLLGFERAKRDQRMLDRIERHDIQYHQQVRERFLQLAKRFEERIVTIDASQKQEKVCSDVWEYIKRHLSL